MKTDIKNVVVSYKATENSVKIDGHTFDIPEDKKSRQKLINIVKGRVFPKE